MTSTSRSCVGLRAYGVSLRVSATDASLLQSMCARAATLGWTYADPADAELDYVVPDSERGFDLACNGETLCRTSDPHALVDAFENHIKIEMAFRAPDHLFVHAGVVGWRGGAIVIPGRSGTGKTTLVEALVRAGADYYSDEFAILDGRGRVHPYAIPLAIRARGGRPADSASVESIGGRAGIMPLPIAHVVLTEYRRRARWRPEPVSPALAMLALMDNTVAALRPPQGTMPILRQALERATVVRSRRGEAGAIARSLLAGSA